MDNPVEASNGGAYDALALRVVRVEGDVTDIKTVLGELKVLMARIDTRIETQLPRLATKVEIAALEARMERRFGEVDRRFGDVDAKFGGLEAKLAAMPSKIDMGGILGVLLTAYACGLAALAVLK